MDEKNNQMYGIGYGKLYLCGEYAILEDYSKAIITSVPKQIFAFISKAEKTTIYDNMHNTEICMNDKHKNFTNIQKLIRFIREYTGIHTDFFLTIHNELITENKKYGLGSSGAVLVAITKAILKFYNIPFDNMKIFKIVVTFSLLNGIKGSMGDVASSCNEGVIYYQKFNQEKLNNYIKNKSPKEIIDYLEWQGLVIELINVKAPVEMIAKWTGEVIDTKIHVKNWATTKKEMNLKTNHLRTKVKRMLEKRKYKKFIDRSNQLTLRLKLFLQQNNPELIIPIIKDIRKNLLYLEQISNIPMETIAMKKYIMKFPCGKQSGSGCGDMVLGFRTATTNKFTINLDLEKL
ncbi:MULTISPECIES: mevalonate kinase [unclassified Gemella]|uniref:mevalonate kinase family protein n=1 Tax=unclassified Gemella TaxID=2624949 RepID=UPI001C055731|nr:MULTISPECIES: phosphomevalonate kinase [unclassified Gemella]MBU0278640.1 phosphomevalonate kinase [Gemella sp. zg-1178]QWQ39196.1 phosphomevalonate kinase [Gemella sp. zg-570]